MSNGFVQAARSIIGIAKNKVNGKIIFLDSFRFAAYHDNMLNANDLTMDEAAKLLGVHRNTIARMIRDGEIKFLWKGRIAIDKRNLKGIKVKKQGRPAKNGRGKQ